MNLSEIKNKLFDKKNLSFEEASFVFNLIMNGEVKEIDTASILIALTPFFLRVLLSNPLDSSHILYLASASLFLLEFSILCLMRLGNFICKNPIFKKGT